MRPSAKLPSMNAHIDHLLHEALGLSADERSALVVALVDSLEGSDDKSIDAAWRAEIRRRRDELRTGLVVATPWLEARTRLAML